MGFLARAFAEEKAQGVYERWLQLLGNMSKSKAGPSVNLDSTFRVAAAFACMAKLSSGVAQVPFKLYQATESDGLQNIRPARAHALYDRISTKPNGWQTSFEFRETLTLHACLGNAYAFKNIFRGELLELILLEPGRVRPEQHPDWSITYHVTGKDGHTEEFAQDAIWHVRGLSWDGAIGLDTLKMAKEALGLSMAAEESHSNLHAKGVRPSGIYSVEGTVDEEQHKKITAWIQKNAGSGNTGVPLILDRGAKWLSQAMSGLDAQHLETRKFQLEEVCRFFNMLPAMIGYSDKATTYASAEQMFIAHVVHTLMPWYVRIEQSADINLLSEKERKQGYYTKFTAGGLLRGAMKDRGDYFARALGSGGGPAWMTQDEVRALEELNPFGGAASALPPLVGRAPAPATP
jgi:HK97 family phage portal protein